MKKHIINLFGIISMIGFLLASCEKKTESSTDVQVTINGTAIDQVALTLNSFMSYEFTVQSSERVGRMELMKNVNGVNSSISVLGYSTGQLEKVAGSDIPDPPQKQGENIYYCKSHLLSSCEKLSLRVIRVCV